MPDALGRDLGDEDQAAVGELRRRIGLVDGDDQLSPEVAVDVLRPELAAGAEPAGVQLTAADEGIAPDVEDVGEVGVDLDLDRQPDRAAAVVDDVEVFVDAARDGPVEADRERVALDLPDVIEKLIVGEFEARREELDRGGVEEDRAAAVDPQLVAGDESGIAGEEAVVHAAENPAVRLADDEAIVPIDRDRGRTDLHRKRHDTNDRFRGPAQSVAGHQPSAAPASRAASQDSRRSASGRTKRAATSAA